MHIKKEVVLLYHMESETVRRLRQICLPMGIRMIEVSSEQESAPLGLLAGAVDWEEPAGEGPGDSLFAENLADSSPEAMPELPVTEPMMILAGLTGRMLDELLGRMRKSRVRISLKAVLTETNARWSGRQVQAELMRERQAFAENLRGNQ